MFVYVNGETRINSGDCIKALMKENNLTFFPHRLNHKDAKIPLHLIRRKYIKIIYY